MIRSWLVPHTDSRHLWPPRAPPSAEYDSNSGLCGLELPIGLDGINLGRTLQGGLPYQPWLATFNRQVGGRTLVVDSIGFRDGLWIDWNGSEIGEAAKNEIASGSYFFSGINVTRT
jgi:hypothetical protein